MRTLNLSKITTGTTFYATMVTYDWGIELNVSIKQTDDADFLIIAAELYIGSMSEWRKFVAERAMQRLTDMNLVKTVNGVTFLDREKFEEWCDV